MKEEVYRLLYEVEDRHWWFRGREAVVGALLGRIEARSSPRILDAGCGTGRNLQRYAKLGPAQGIEPSQDAVDFCRQRGLENVIQGRLEDLPFADAHFDLLMATDVLEHVEDDGLALRELHRVAAPNAFLVLTVPAYSWMWSREDERLGHRRRYTRAQMRRVATANGWKPRLATYFNTILLPPIALARRLRRSGGGAELALTPSVLDGPLSLPMRFEARLIGLGVRLPAGVSVGMVCERAD